MISWFIFFKCGKIDLEGEWILLSFCCKKKNLINLSLIKGQFNRFRRWIEKVYRFLRSKRCDETSSRLLSSLYKKNIHIDKHRVLWEIIYFSYYFIFVRVLISDFIRQMWFEHPINFVQNFLLTFSHVYNQLDQTSERKNFSLSFVQPKCSWLISQ